MLIIAGISNQKKTNELIICGILCRNVTILHRQELTFLFQMQEKLKTFRVVVSLPMTAMLKLYGHM